MVSLMKWTSAAERNRRRRRLLLLVVILGIGLPLTSVQSIDRCDVSSVLVPDANVNGGSRSTAGNNVTECEIVCSEMTSCLGFDWSREYSECYLLTSDVDSINYNVSNVDHYDLIRDTNHCIGSCSYPRWVPIVDQHGFGGIFLDNATGLADCARRCIVDANCAAFDWNPSNPEGRKCWIILSSSTTAVAPAPGVFHYDKATTCTPIVPKTTATVDGSLSSSMTTTTVPVVSSLPTTSSSSSTTTTASPSTSTTPTTTTLTVPLPQSTHPISSSSPSSSSSSSSLSSPSSTTTSLSSSSSSSSSSSTTTTTTTTTTRIPSTSFSTTTRSTSPTSKTTLPIWTSVESVVSTGTTNRTSTSTSSSSTLSSGTSVASSSGTVTTNSTRSTNAGINTTSTTSKTTLPAGVISSTSFSSTSATNSISSSTSRSSSAVFSTTTETTTRSASIGTETSLRSNSGDLNATENSGRSSTAAVSSSSSTGINGSTTWNTTTTSSDGNNATSNNATGVDSITATHTNSVIPDTSTPGKPNGSNNLFQDSEDPSSVYSGMSIKPVYVVLAAMGGGCLLLVVTAVCVLCQFPLNGGPYGFDGRLKGGNIVPYDDTRSVASSSNELLDMDLFVVEPNSQEFRSSSVIATEFEAASVN